MSDPIAVPGLGVAQATHGQARQAGFFAGLGGRVAVGALDLELGVHAVAERVLATDRLRALEQHAAREREQRRGEDERARGAPVGSQVQKRHVTPALSSW